MSLVLETPRQPEVRVVLARKAPLTFKTRAPLRVRIASVATNDLRRRIIDRTIAEGATVYVPAGLALIAADSSTGERDIFLVRLGPGQRQVVEPKPSVDAVAIVRCVSGRTGSPLEDASLQSNARQLARTNADGFAVVRGRPGRLGLRVSHPRTLNVDTEIALGTEVPDFADVVDVPIGASPLFRVSVGGVAVSGASARLVGSTGDPGDDSGDRGPRGTTNEKGEWRPSRVPPGKWLFIVRPEPGRPYSQEPIDLEDGTTQPIEIALRKISVSGLVRRGGLPVAGMKVAVQPEAPRRSMVTLGRKTDRVAESDLDGRYETYVFAAGRYFFYVIRDDGFGVAAERVQSIQGDTEVDFDLASNDLGFVVVDENGTPLPDARLTITRSLPDGALSRTGVYPLDSGGRAHVTVARDETVKARAALRGYTSGESETIDPGGGTVPAEVTLTLKKSPVFQGRVTTGLAEPVRGAIVVAAAENGTALPSSGQTDQDGRFEVTLGGRRFFRLYLLGEKIPLTVRDVYDAGLNENLFFVSGDVGELEIRLEDDAGRPLPGRMVALGNGGNFVPPAVLAKHLLLRGSALISDARGLLVIPDVEGGEIDILVPDVAGPTGGPYVHRASIRGGARTTVRLVVSTSKNG